MDHTGYLTFLLTTFNIFETGATILISIIFLDLGKEELLKNKRRAVATISGIADGTAGIGSILGQLLVSPVKQWKGWSADFAMFSLAAIIAGIPTLPFMVREIRLFIRQKKKEKDDADLKKTISPSD